MRPLGRRVIALEEIAVLARRRQLEIDVTDVVRPIALEHGLAEPDTDRAITGVALILEHWTEEQEALVRNGISPRVVAIGLARELGLIDPVVAEELITRRHRR